MTSSNGNIFCVTGPLCKEGEFPPQRPVTRSFDVLFYMCLNKRLGEQSGYRWFITPFNSLWGHCNMKWTRIVIVYQLWSIQLQCDDAMSWERALYNWSIMRGIALPIAPFQLELWVRFFLITICQYEVRDDIWWSHEMDTLFAVLAFCEGNPPVAGGLPLQRANDAKLWCFHWWQSAQTAEQTIQRQVN